MEHVTKFARLRESFPDIFRSYHFVTAINLPDGTLSPALVKTFGDKSVGFSRLDGDQIVAISIREPKIVNEDLRLLSEMRGLKSIGFVGQKKRFLVQPEDICKLVVATNCKVLNVFCDQLGSDDLIKAISTTHLQALAIASTHVSNEAIRVIASMDSLVALSLSAPAITDLSVIDFLKMRRLRYLLLRNTCISQTEKMTIKRELADCMVRFMQE